MLFPTLSLLLSPSIFLFSSLPSLCPFPFFILSILRFVQAHIAVFQQNDDPHLGKNVISSTCTLLQQPKPIPLQYTSSSRNKFA